jgi:limonene-1,2-epoxide hydrolase
MSNIDIIRHFYSLPRNTAADRGELLAMLADDIHYVGIGKESAQGRAAIERLFRKYEGSGQADIKFTINHIAENGDTVMVDMVDTFLIQGKSIDIVFSNVFKVRDGKIVYWQEHYDRSRLEAAFAKPIPVTESRPTDVAN